MTRGLPPKSVGRTSTPGSNKVWCSPADRHWSQKSTPAIADRIPEIENLADAAQITPVDPFHRTESKPGAVARVWPPRWQAEPAHVSPAQLAPPRAKQGQAG